MLNQTCIEFPTGSPINVVSLGKQNQATYDALMRGERLNRFNALEKYGIGTLHSRVPEVIKAMDWKTEDVKRRHISIRGVVCCEYWLEYEFINRQEFKNKQQ